ncbi:4-phosphoerythronate dehydrogenase [Thiomicrorhabdus sp. ZW0627]|uniref:4-phosphoerythronate dehydrogenase n=1 Tax=Thiomicrorhabdus sp. ZW0627 TaxID=3039774 RepID=UPI0024368CF2|nr:4-phosphoerythronate dehydrogenase [Thiomicrorhabdus sp. ZW0627]MDG6774890.1 4-phosphoerythronate dehydrogenase [Thiomicrorhabdus sp. ZW0627]
MADRKTIVIDDAVPYAEAMFQHLGNIITLPGREIDAEAVSQADAVIVRSRTKVNQALLKNSRVSFVGSTVVGLDHIDQPYLKNQGIRFYSAQGCNANSVAEYVITCLLEVAEDKGFNLKEKTLGIVGVGHVGSLVYEKAKTLGIRCLLNDPPKVEQQPEIAKSYVDLDSCLQADIITFHTPLTKNGAHPTYHLLSEQRLSHIRPDQIIVNAARGGIIDELAWIKTNTLANIIDCWENEPFIDPDLYRSAYIATPHIAGHSLDAKVAGGEMVYRQLCDYWGIKPQTEWQSLLPPEPEILTINPTEKLQSALYQTLKSTHDPRNDDRAIRSEDIKIIYEKYEFYRRNFPAYREWKHHKFHTTENEIVNETLLALGLQTY